MALVYTDDQNYTNIADALRTRLGTEDPISPTDMADKIMNITYGVKEIKGAAEDEFREGSVVLTPADLGALAEDATAVRSIADENGDNIRTTYEKIENIASKGSTTNPVYFDENGIAHTIESYDGNAATSTKLQSPTSMTIGDATKMVDGSQSVSWSREEIGAMKASVIQNPGDSDFILEIGY